MDIWHALLSFDWGFHLPARDEGLPHCAGIYDCMLGSAELLTYSMHFDAAVIVLNVVFDGKALSFDIGVGPGCDFAGLAASLEVMLVGIVLISMGNLG